MSGNIMLIRLNYLASVPYLVIGHQDGSEHDDQDPHIEDRSRKSAVRKTKRLWELEKFE